MNNQKRIISNILLSMFIFFLFIIALEIILRTTHLFGAKLSWSEPDSIIGFKFVPGKKYWFKKEIGHPITGRVNSYGFRDKEWILGKPSDTFRVAVLGDSYVEAFQVESEHTFIALTEDKLNDNQNGGHKFELMNFGRSGYTQTQELLILKNDVVQFSPDMVVLFFLPGNDISDISRETATNVLSPFYIISNSGELMLDTSFSKTFDYKIRAIINGIKQRSALISLIGERYNAYMEAKRKRFINMSLDETSLQLTDKITGYLSLCTDSPDHVYFKNYELNKRLIKEMSDFTKKRGIQFMLVTIDIPTYVPEIERKLMTISPTFNTNFFEDDLRDYAKMLHIEYIGLQRIFNKYYEDTGVFLHWLKHDGHWNYQGHEVVADALVNKLNLIISPELKEMGRDNETGLTFEPRNALELSKKIEYMLDNPDKAARMGENARRFIEQKLDAEDHYQRLMGIYHEAVRKSRFSR